MTNSGSPTCHQTTIDWYAAEPLDEHALGRLAVLGGVSSGRPGEHRCSATFTVEACADGAPWEAEWHRALTTAIERVSEVLPGHLLAVELVAADEADRRLARPPAQ